MLLRKLAHISKDGASPTWAIHNKHIFNVSYLRRIESFYLPPTAFFILPTSISFQKSECLSISPNHCLKLV